MSIPIQSAQRAARFTRLAHLDIFVHRQHLECSESDHLVLGAGAGRRLSNRLARLQELMECIAMTSAPVAFGCGRGFTLSETGRRLWKGLLTASREVPEQCAAGRQLNPWLTLGLRLARKWVPRLRVYSAAHDVRKIDVNEAAPRRMLAHVAKVIRRVCKSRQFRARVTNDARRARDNYVSCANLMIELFKRDARLLILRVDLYFEGDAKYLSDSDDAEAAYCKFLRNLRENCIVPHVLGYIGKREDGLERRVHYHVLVAIDGNEHRSAFHMTERLRSFWDHECVGAKSLGSSFNCWTRRREHEYPCIGLLHYTDSHMLMGLREAIEYLCKEDNQVVIEGGRGRNLRKSQTPRDAEVETRRGAPRKHDREMSAAHQVLLTFDPPPLAPKRPLCVRRENTISRMGRKVPPRLPIPKRIGLREDASRLP